MKKVINPGKCIQCGKKTYIQLNNSQYACIECLNNVAKETNNIKEYLDTISKDIKPCNFINLFIETLYVMEANNVTSVNNVIKTLEAINMYNKYKNGTLDEENRKKIEKELDFF